MKGGVCMIDSVETQEMLSRVAAVIEDTIGFCDEVTLESRIVEDLEADSVDRVSLATALEDEFDIEIPDEEIINLTTVGKAIEFIISNMG